MKTRFDIYSFCIAESFWLAGLEAVHRWAYVRRSFPDASLDALADGLAMWEEGRQLHE